MSDTSPTRPDSTRPGPTDLASSLTSARLSLGNTSPSVSTADHLRFQLDHALARDAVHTPLDIPLLHRGLTQRGLQPITLHSGVDALFAPGAPPAELRRTYLRRPDLGRSLHPESVLELQQIAAHQPTAPDIALILADGLSSLALERHALPLLDALWPLLPTPYSLIPVVQNARVAIADPIGHILRAHLTVLLIGERPGLSSPDSLGCYITWSPRPGRTDAERNCISNIRGDAGLSYAEAAHRIGHYLREAHRLHTTGTALKDPSTTPHID
jgi:ethanolamine ammonia-lyase small subunit